MLEFDDQSNVFIFIFLDVCFRFAVPVNGDKLSLRRFGYPVVPVSVGLTYRSKSMIGTTFFIIIFFSSEIYGCHVCSLLRFTVLEKSLLSE